MKKNSSLLMGKNTVLALTIFSIFAFQMPVKAESTLDWRVDGLIQGQYNSNIAQIK